MPSGWLVAGYLTCGAMLVRDTGWPKTRGEWLGVPLVLLGWPIILVWALISRHS